MLKLWGATAERKDLLAASGRLAAARATMRLFDDAVALKTMLAYGLGEQVRLLRIKNENAMHAFTIFSLQSSVNVK